MKKLGFLFLILLLPLGLWAQSYYQWVEKADSCIKAKDWAGAEHALLSALRTEPANGQNSLLMSNLGTVQRYAGKYDEALRSYSNGLLMTPNSVTLLRNRAALYSEIDSIDLAYNDYSQILMIDDSDEDALYQRGLIELGRGDTISSRADFERLLKINPASANGRIGFASLLKVMGYYPEAIEVYLSNGILYGPAKASNAGGVATSGLEMSQNSERLSWSFEEVDAKLKGIMEGIFHASYDASVAAGSEGNLMVGANCAGFLKVATAMMAQGITY